MRSMIPHHFPLSHGSIKIRFAYRFLRALKKLNKPRTTTTTTPTTSMRETTRRYHIVKTAAYASMASAVGSKRAWSRALLWKIRNRGLSRAHVVMKRNKARGSSLKKTITENPSKASELQKLIPGGEVMDFCSLLDETAHYIKCLTSQVETSSTRKVKLVNVHRQLRYNPQISDSFGFNGYKNKR